MVVRCGLAAVMMMLMATSGAMAADLRHPVVQGYGAIMPVFALTTMATLQLRGWALIPD
jgi:hypothetical protein